MDCFPDLVLKHIFHYTTLRERRALQITCQRFQETGNIPGMVERQIINTYKGVPPELYGAVPDPTLVTILEKKTGYQLASQPAYLLLAGYLKVAPTRKLRTFNAGHWPNGLHSLGSHQLASYGYDGNIKIWDITTWQCLITLGSTHGHSDWVNGVCPLGDDRLASGSSDHTIKIWNIKTGECLKTLGGQDGHSYHVTSVCFLGNDRLVSGSYQEAKIWNIKTGECLRTLVDPEGPRDIKMDTLCPLGNNQFFSAHYKIKIWNSETGQHSKFVNGGLDSISAIVDLRNGQLASFSGTDCHTIHIWDMATGECLKKLRHEKPVDYQIRAGGLSTLGNGQLVSYFAEDRTIRIWHVETGQCLKTLKGLATSACALGNGQIASSPIGDTIEIWGYDTGVS